MYSIKHQYIFTVLTSKEGPADVSISELVKKLDRREEELGKMLYCSVSQLVGRDRKLCHGFVCSFPFYSTKGF